MKDNKYRCQLNDNGIDVVDVTVGKCWGTLGEI
jgi:hypothetical protein